jgi:Uma2 family endonuclease
MEDNRQTEINEPDFNYAGIYTYADYLKWTIEARLELIKGKIFRMSPAPNRMHQSVSMRIATPIFNLLRGKECQVYSAPFDVRLPRKSKKDEDIITVVQPDICVICDPSRLDDRGCIGAPDIVVEILSPSNNRKELKNKYEVYEESGVKEYWIVSPVEKTFFRYILDENEKFQPTHLLTTGDIVTTPILPGLGLNLDEVFED